MSTLARSVNVDRASLAGAIGAVRERIAAAARRSGRDPAEITLIGAVKAVPPECIRVAVEAGLTDLGENRVQEAELAIDAIGRRMARWHMIGHLQRNKASRAVERFDRIHGVDDEELARALSRRAETLELRLPVLIQINISKEGSKFGVAPEAASRLVQRVATMKGLALDGLMSIGAPVARPEDARGAFAWTREVRDRAERETGVVLRELSMGMSDDFEIAVEEGSTMVRVGTALFGARP
jgi:pyridoxal phosphate enzyme (YggS family)